MASNFVDFDQYQEKFTRQALEEKMCCFLKKDARVEGYFELSDGYLKVYDALPTQSERHLEYVLKLVPSTEIKPNTQAPHPEASTGLMGKRIAIDPGHLGGAFCRLEERYIDIPSSLERNLPIRFDEGTLSYLTAHYLKVLLEKEGAIVFLTRKAIGQGSLEQGFFAWLQENPQLWSTEITLGKLFKTYNQMDLYSRAEKINQFGPDLTIVIHFNAHHGLEQASSNNQVTANNFNMVFIPGAFVGEELKEQQNRYEFMRLLTSEDLQSSLALSRAIIEKFTKNLQIPVVTANDGARYLDSACLKIEEGIYARNLALTRRVHGPVCYGETLIQNNIDECLNLSRKDFVIDGTPCSSRIKQVAEAYFEGIKSYLSQKNP